MIRYAARASLYLTAIVAAWVLVVVVFGGALWYGWKAIG